MKQKLFVSGFAIGCASIALVACSSSSSSSATQPDASGDDAGADAPDYRDVYPAPHPGIPDMKYFGGRVIHHPELVTVTFRGMDPTLRDYLRDFGDKITSTDWWHKVMDGFDVQDGTSTAHVELPDPFSGQIFSDDQVKSWVASQITNGALPFPNVDTMYLIYVPYGGQVTLGNDVSCQNFGGYHGAGDVVTDGGTKRFVYAILNDCRGPNGTPQQLKDDQTYVASHEIAEAATDPDINTSDNGGWYMPPGNDAWVTSRAGGENADLCNGLGWKEGIWEVTRVWNAASVRASGAPCLPSPTAWYFNAAAVTENPHKDQMVGPNADGYFVVKKGETRTMEVDVFSTQPLPNPMTIRVGQFATPVTGQPYDPTHSFPIYTGVTATLSQDTAVNGDRVYITITVAPTVHTVTHRFSVRAVLNATDYHSWPVILYVP